MPNKNNNAVEIYKGHLKRRRHGFMLVNSECIKKKITS